MKARMIGEGALPLICTPLVGKTREAVLEELTVVLPKGPDAVEWRADFFAALGDTAAVVELGREISRAASGRVVIFTIRSHREGGQPIALSDRAAIELAAVVCAKTDIEYVDCELSNQEGDIAFLREAAHAHGKLVIASFHDFAGTPERGVLRRKFLEAERLGLDVAKVAVMPKSLEDVLALLGATLEAKQTIKLPLITMSMGGYGAVSRMVGGVFGSSLSFAVGQNASAPGQIPIDELRTVLGIVERSKGAR
jgi:3-dehydroquinate dehydratase-1